MNIEPHPSFRAETDRIAKAKSDGMGSCNVTKTYTFSSPESLLSRRLETNYWLSQLKALDLISVYSYVQSELIDIIDVYFE